MDIKSIWMAGFHIGFNEDNDWRDEILYDNWLNNINKELAMCEANSNDVLADMRAAVDEWLAEIAHRKINAPTAEERKVWNDCIDVSGKYYNKIHAILSENFS